MVGNPVNLPHLARAGPLYDKPVYLPRTHPIYTTAPSVNPWRRGKSYFSPTRQAGLLDGRAVGARNRRGANDGASSAICRGVRRTQAFPGTYLVKLPPMWPAWGQFPKCLFHGPCRKMHVTRGRFHTTSEPQCRPRSRSLRSAVVRQKTVLLALSERSPAHRSDAPKVPYSQY